MFDVLWNQRLFGRVAVLVLSLVLALGLAGAAQANPKLLVDMYSGEVLYAEEAGQPWHPASLTKLMTAFVAFEAIATGKVGLDTPVILSARANKAPPSKVGLPVDTAMTLEDALYILIVKSANDVAIAIAETVAGSVEGFVAEMNENAALLGLTATHFVNPHGLHDVAQTVSARDLAILALTIRARYPQYDDMFETQTVELGQVNLRTHNDLLTRFAGSTGMKTGYVCAAGLNIVATAERGGRALMAVVLGAASARERREMTAELLLKGFAGAVAGAGTSIVALENQSGAAPVDMRPQMCGTEAKSYAAERAAAYPYGLKGQPSFASDTVLGRSHIAATLGRLRNVPLPRPRPLWAPVAPAPDDLPVPLPRPRPLLEAGL